MISHDHTVQFYNDDTFLTESLASFIKDGLQVNDTVIIVATAKHREALVKTLTPQEMAHDKLMFFDAGEQLWRFMVDDWPSEFQFRKVVRGMIGQASQNGRVRIFGEMVAVLWAEGYTRAAIRLEELWNKLATEQSFSLLCAYPLSKFTGGKDKGSLLAISQLHTHVYNPHSSVSG
jgi:DcmR-like sensory protein